MRRIPFAEANILQRAPLYFVLCVSMAACGSDPWEVGLVPTTDNRCLDGCTIRLDTSAVLGSPGDTIWPRISATAVRDASGRFFVGMMDHPGTLAIYSPDGKIESVFGRSGSGPGEISSWLVWLARGPGDTISILDVLGRRRTLVDSHGSYIRDHPIPFQVNSAFSFRGDLLVQADIRSPEMVGKPIHALDDKGAVVESYGEVAVYRRPEVDGVRQVSPSVNGGGVWVAPPNEYRLEYWDENLNFVRSLAVDTEAFLPNDGSVGDPRLFEPLPRIVDIAQTDSSFVWVLIRTAPAKWRPSESQQEKISPATRAFDFDWILDAVDVASGDRVATLRFDQQMLFGMGDSVLYEQSEGTNGRVILTALIPQLQEASR